MDKNTLSNYGWIVIAVLVLSVMIALATPFGSYIEQGVRATTEGLFDASKEAMNTAFADLGVQMDDQEFEEGYTGVDGSGTQTKKELTTLTAKTWTGLTYLNGDDIWTDGTNTYYSYGSDQYVLNGDTWEQKTWNGLTEFFGSCVWTDGTNTCYSRGNANCRILNGDTWEIKTRKGGLSTVYGDDIWTDGTNTYYSSGTAQYVLNSTGTQWNQKTWNGLTDFYAGHIWTDGTNIYYSNIEKFSGTAGNYILNGDTWEEKTWSGLTSFSGGYIWTDGTNTYYSNAFSTGEKGNYVLNKETDTWEPKIWNGFTNIDGHYIWTDGTNYYCSFGKNQYVFS